MTIFEAIGQLDAQKPNNFPLSQKLGWLTALDAQVRREVLGDNSPITPYGEDTQQDLLIPAPYDECYLRYLEAQIDYLHGELDRYQNAMALFNAIYSAFSAWHLRQNLPQNRAFSF